MFPATALWSVLWVVLPWQRDLLVDWPVQMSLQRTARLLLSTLTTYSPDRDQDTALMDELKREGGIIKGTVQHLASHHSQNKTIVIPVFVREAGLQVVGRGVPDVNGSVCWSSRQKTTVWTEEKERPKKKLLTFYTTNVLMFLFTSCSSFTIKALQPTEFCSYIYFNIFNILRFTVTGSGLVSVTDRIHMNPQVDRWTHLPAFLLIVILINQVKRFWPITKNNMWVWIQGMLESESKSWVLQTRTGLVNYSETVKMNTIQQSFK